MTSRNSLTNRRGFLMASAGQRRSPLPGLAVPVNKKAAGALQSPGDAPNNIKLLVAGAEHNKNINSTKATATAVALYRPQLERVDSGDLTARKARTDIRPQVEAAINQ